MSGTGDAKNREAHLDAGRCKSGSALDNRLQQLREEAGRVGPAVPGAT